VAYIVTRPHDANAEKKTFWSHPVARQWGTATSEPVEILCFGNGEPTLTCGGEEIRLTRDEENGYWVAVTTPRPASLVLEIRRDGRVVARDELGPTGDAVQIDAAAWLAPADAMRRCADAGLATGDIVQIECTLRDRHRKVASGESVVTAAVEGGELLGLENGDLSDNTPYTARQRRTLDGRLIVFVRPAGSTIVRLSAPGLPDVQVECGA
jgi:hypothetical protein